jgi:hypothetical protein
MNTHRPHAVALSIALAALITLATPAVARADGVTEWNAIASSAIVTTAGQSPHASTLSLAMVQGAVYDAVNAIDQGHRPYLAAPAANPRDSTEAAAATAAFRVLVALFPAQQSTLQPLYEASLASVPDGPAKAGGIAAGEAAAAAMLAARANDGRGGSFTFVPGTAPGAWGGGAPPGGPPIGEGGGLRRRRVPRRSSLWTQRHGSDTCARSSFRMWRCFAAMAQTR